MPLSPPLANTIPLGSLLAFAAFFPVLLRWKTLDHAKQSHFTHSFLLGQDLLVAIIFGILLSSVCAGRSPVAASLAASGSLTIFHLIFFLDAALQKILNARFSLRFLPYARQMSMYMDSSRKAGIHLPILAVAVVTYAAALFTLLLGIFRQWGTPQISWIIWPILALLALAATASLRGAEPSDLNPILFRLDEWLRRARSHLPRNPGEVVDSFLTNEQRTTSDPERPLFRETTGFAGARHFELNLKPGSRPDVIFLFLESFCAELIGVIDEETGGCPNFNALSKEGILFRNFYGNGVQTSRAVMASLFGIPPRLSETPEQADLRTCPRLRGLPHFFAELGYHNAYHHNGWIEFEEQDLFFPRQGYQEIFGHDDIRRKFPEAPIVGGWGVPDEFLMRHFVEWFAARRARGAPTFSTLFTMSNHYPFEVPPGFTPPKFSYPGNAEKEDVLRTFSYTDHCLQLLVDLLRKGNLFENTLLVILADTAQPLGRHDNWVEQKFLFEDNLRIPLLLLGPGIIREPMIIDEPASQLDLLPTILDVFGRPFTNHAVGSSLARINPDRRIYCNNPFGNQFIAERVGRLKLIHELRTNRTSLYDLIDDPLERADLAAIHPHITNPWRDRLLKANALFGHLHTTRSFC